MSRASLVMLCKGLGVITHVQRSGKQIPYTAEALRALLLERLYGPGFHWEFGSVAAADAQIARGIACKNNDYGYLLSMAQHSLACARAELNEVSRLKALKSAASPATVAKIIPRELSAKQWLQMAATYQNLHSIDVGIRDNKPSDYREPVNAH